MILIIDLTSRKLSSDEFAKPISNIASKHDECEIINYASLRTKNIDRADKIILSGTALADNEFLKKKKDFEWLKSYEKPVLGICAGMQLICAVFGSEIIECKEIGMTKIRTTKKNALFSSEFEAYELHKNSAKPSSCFEVLAENNFFVQAVKHKEKQMYGILFHPEVRNSDIVERFVKI
jgi:GMP synthase (glutamine-hydrolysing)